MIALLYYIRTFVLWLNTKLGCYKTTLWLIGDARSGTTWISSLLNPDHKLRELFEPIHPILVDAASHLKINQYVRPGEASANLRSFCSEIFTGNFYHLRVDRASKRLSYNGLLIKDIFANLLARAVTEEQPHVRTALLIRNPFAVALSKKSKDDWDWQMNPKDFLNDANLMADFLAPFEKTILETVEKDDYILNQVLIWAIVNYVPLKQFRKEELPVLFYESALSDPEGEIRRIKEELGLLKPGQSFNIPQSVIRNPSAVTEKEAGSFRSNLTSWKKGISELQLEQGIAILNAFKMRDFFDEDWKPQLEAVYQFMPQN